MTAIDCDIVILGAGFAGAAAACEASRRGLTAIIVEARDRVGGRAYSRRFGGNGPVMEFGGGWIAPWHQRVRRYAQANGIALRPTHPVLERRYHDGKTLRRDLPAPPEARRAFDAAMIKIRKDALAHERGERGNTGLSLNAYLDTIGASPEARAHVLAWWTISGNGDPAVVSAEEFISSCAYGGGDPQGMLDKLQHTLEAGASVLVEQMIAGSGAELKLRSPVVRLSRSDHGVIAALNGGEVVHARFAACCLPLNALAAVDFDPPLPDRKARAARIGHAGGSVKLWIEAEGVSPGVIATGGGSGLQWMFSERKASQATVMIACFGFPESSFDPSKRTDVDTALHRFFPEARLVNWDWHDWVRDEFARGTWVAVPADAPWIADHGVWQPEDRIAFATSDFAAESPGWFESAIASGEAAAEAIAGRLAL